MSASQGNEELFHRSMNQGHSAAWEGRWQEAVGHYNRALQEFPDNPQTLNHLALAQLELGNLDQALELYRRAARLSPEDPLPAEKSAQIYEQLGRTADAIKSSMQAAELHLRVRDADKAANNWTRVIALDPNNMEAHSHLAKLHEKLGRTPQAIAEYIAVAALQQRAGGQEEALQSGEHALSLNPKNREAQEAVAMLKAQTPLPKPLRHREPKPSRHPDEGARLTRTKTKSEFEESPDPIQEATQKSLQELANLLFELSSSEAGVRRKQTRRLPKGTTPNEYIARGADQSEVAHHLSRALELQTGENLHDAADALEAAIQAGLTHPAAAFNLAILLTYDGDVKNAELYFRQSQTHPDFALGSYLDLGNIHRDQGRYHEAVVDYLEALKLADSSVVPKGKTGALRAAYEPLIEAAERSKNDAEIKSLCENIRYLLIRPNWHSGLHEARGQLPSTEGGPLVPVAEILTNEENVRLMDSLVRINKLAKDGLLRAAMEEAFAALEVSPSYLPLHIQMGELLMMNDRPQQAIEKLSTVARVYSTRGEYDRATQMYERIVVISPLDVDSRIRLIEQLNTHGNIQEAVRQQMDLADVYYRLAQLNKARDTYEQALRMTQGADEDASLNIQILHRMADIDLQRLDWRKAVRVFEQLRTLAPNDETARLNLVQLNLRLGQEGKANVEMDNYLSSLTSRGREQDADSFLVALLEENPSYHLGHRRLAEHYQQNGQRDLSIREWNKVGELLVAAGDREGAKAAVRAILALNPPNAQRYQQFLDRLNK